MAVWETALVLLILSTTILVIIAIPVVNQLRQSLKKIDKTFDTLNADLPDILEDLKVMGESFSNISQRIEDMTDDVAELEETLVTEIKEPLQNIASVISSVLQLGNRLVNRRKTAKSRK
jgi:predicted PurR-regulated permease PerM